MAQKLIRNRNFQLLLLEVIVIQLGIIYPKVIIPAVLAILVFVVMSISPLLNIAIMVLFLSIADIFPGIPLGAFSVSPMQILIFVAYFHWFLRLVYGEKSDFSIFKNKFFYLIVAFFLLSAFSLRVATSITASIRFLRDMLFWMMFGFYAVYHMRTFENFKKVLDYFIYAAVLVGVLGVIQVVFKINYFVLVPGRWMIKEGGEFFRLNATFRDPNFLGNFLVGPFLFGLTQMVIAHDFKKWPSMVFLFFILILTNSRGAMLSVLVTVALLLFIVFRHHKHFVRIVLSLLFTVLGLASLFYVLPKYYYQRLLPNFYSVDWAIIIRIMYLYITYNVIVANPLWGIGLNNFPIVFRKYTPDVIWQSLTLGNTPGVLQGGGYNHNTFLTIWAETGVFNFLLFIIMLLFALQFAFKIWNVQELQIEKKSVLIGCIMALMAISVQLLTITNLSYHFYFFLFTLIPISSMYMQYEKSALWTWK